MARKQAAMDPTNQRLVDSAEDPTATAGPNHTPSTDVGDSGPELADGHDEIVEEAPGIHPVTDVMSSPADLGDPSAFDRSGLLPDTTGFDEDPALGDLSNPGGVAGSTLLDDLGAGSDLPDPIADFDGMSDGWSQPVFNDDPGRAMEGGGSFPLGSGPPDIGQWDTIESTTEVLPSGAVMTSTSWEPAVLGDDPEEGQSSHGTDQPGGGTDPDTDDPWWGNTLDPDDDEGLRQDAGDSPPPLHQDWQVPRDTYEDPADEEDEQDPPRKQGDGHEPQTSDGPTQGPEDSTPIPPEADDGTGGEPDAGDFTGGRGDVDPAPEAVHGDGGGGLDMERAGFGAVDLAPETDDVGGEVELDLERLGVGAVDPLDGESALLGGDTGDLAAMAADADVEDVEFEFDDSLADADIGGDV